MKCVLCLTLLVIAAMTSAADRPAERREQRNRRIAWWREARFGLFIHFGLYAIPAGEYGGKTLPKGRVGEWIMNDLAIPVAEYEKLAERFNPTKFDARQWVRAAKTAGARYIVITSKHHDGFCLWDSKVTAYDVVDATPFKRDILKEMADACAAEGITLCFYYSIMDWHHPDAQAPHHPTYNTDAKKNPAFPRYVETYLKPQVRELLTSYGRVGVLWFDGEWIPEWTEEMGKDLESFCRSLQPELIVNNRVGKGRKGMQGMSKDGSFAGDFGTPEQEIPPAGFPGLDWESCMTMNDTWGYRRDDDNWKPSATLLEMLIESASKGGNFLLNVGPTAEGEFPQPSLQRLGDIGKWMNGNGEAIYGTSAGPFGKLPYGYATSKPGRIYLHVLNWPKLPHLLVPLRNDIDKAYVLGSPEKLLGVRSEDDGSKLIAVPPAAPHPVASVIVVEFQGEPRPFERIRRIGQSADGTLTLLAEDGMVFGRKAKLEKKGDNPLNIGFWTDVRDYVQWHVRMEKPGRYEVFLEYSCPPTSAGSEYTLEILDQTIKARVEPTKSFLDFQTVPLGTVELKAADGTVTLRPAAKPKLAVMDLRRVILKLVP